MVRKNIGPVIQEEKQTVMYMLDIYYSYPRHQGRQKEKQALEKYVMTRLDFCRFGDKKPTCKTCPKHCYRQDYQDKIQEVMRFSGPRMLMKHPILTFKHLIKEKRRAEGVH